MSLLSSNAGLQVQCIVLSPSCILLVQASRAAAVKHAEGVSRTTVELTGGTDSPDLRDLKEALEISKKETEGIKRETLAFKRQSERVAREYDRGDCIVNGYNPLKY